MSELLFEGLGPERAAGALAAALGFALWVVLRRPLARRAVVAYGALWERALARGRGGLPWREIAALLLFVAALASVAAGVAGPKLATRAPRRIVVLVDSSASMDARDAAGRRRLDLAKVAAARVAKAARPGDAVAIFRVSSRVTPLAPWELAVVEVDDASEDLALAAAMADTFLAQGVANAERRVVVLSDRAEAFAPPSGGFTRDTVIDRIPIGTAAENLAVARLGISTGSASEGGLDLLVTIVNEGASDATADLVLHTAKFRLGGARVAVPAGSRVSSAFHLAGAPEQEVWASLDHIAFASGGSDALARDDRRGAWAPDRGAIDVVVVGDRPNRFLDGALAVQGGVRARRVDPARATAASLASADVVVIDGVATPRGLDGSGKGLLVLGAAQGRKVEAPVLTDWNGDHPTTAKVSLDDLTLASARILTPRAGEVVLAASAQGPIALARAEGTSRSVTLGFDPSRSDFPLRLSYPVFVGSAVRWLAGADADRAPLFVVAGKLPAGRKDRGFAEKRDGESGESLSSGGWVVAGVYRDGARAVEVGIDPREHSLAVEGATGEPRLPEWIADAAPVRSRSWTSLLFALGAILLVLKAWAG